MTTIPPPVGPGSPAEVADVVERAVLASPAYHGLDDRARGDLGASLAQVASYLRHGEALGAGGAAPVRQLAPDLGSLRRGHGSQPSGTGPAPTGGGPNGAAAGSAPAGAPATPTGRVGEVARATLNAIDFPSFVGSLIQGTFQAIVDASIQQMEAYAEMLKQVAGTVDQFMTENVTPGMAQDYLADRYDGILERDTSAGAPRLRVSDEAPEGELPSFFSDLGFTGATDLDENAVDDVLVPAARRSMAEQRQQTLATMVLMGINRVVVSDGEITAKLLFHIDASESTELKFDQTKTTVGNMARTAGRSPFSANGVLVNTTSVNAQSDINVRADLTGQVTVRFRSETFPLERFADSYAIQLINSNAKVPPPPVQPAAGTAPAAPAPGAPSGAPAPAPAAAPPAPAAQSLGPDPWAPEA